LTGLRSTAQEAKRHQWIHRRLELDEEIQVDRPPANQKLPDDVGLAPSELFGDEGRVHPLERGEVQLLDERLVDERREKTLDKAGMRKEVLVAPVVIVRDGGSPPS
jgi:hypothetical protein